MTLSVCKTIICIQPDSSNIISYNDTTKTQNYQSFCINNDKNITNIHNKSILSCPNNTECSIICIGNMSCKGLTIQCPINNKYKCNINCIDELSCLSTTIQSKQSSELILNCNAIHSCTDINILCPLNTEYKPNCKIKGI